MNHHDDPVQNSVKKKRDEHSKSGRQRKIVSDLVHKLECYFFQHTFSKQPEWFRRLLPQETDWVNLDDLAAASDQNVPKLAQEIRPLFKKLVDSSRVIEANDTLTAVRRRSHSLTAEDCGIFVDNLPPEADEASIKEAFENFGPPLAVEIPLRKSKLVQVQRKLQNKSICFIFYSDPATVQRILNHCTERKCSPLDAATSKSQTSVNEQVQDDYIQPSCSGEHPVSSKVVPEKGTKRRHETDHQLDNKHKKISVEDDQPNVQSVKSHIVAKKRKPAEDGGAEDQLVSGSKKLKKHAACSKHEETMQIKNDTTSVTSSCNIKHEKADVNANDKKSQKTNNVPSIDLNPSTMTTRLAAKKRKIGNESVEGTKVLKKKQLEKGRAEDGRAKPVTTNSGGRKKRKRRSSSLPPNPDEHEKRRRLDSESNKKMATVDVSKPNGGAEQNKRKKRRKKNFNRRRRYLQNRIRRQLMVDNLTVCSYADWLAAKREYKAGQKANFGHLKTLLKDREKLAITLSDDLKNAKRGKDKLIMKAIDACNPDHLADDKSNVT